MFCWVCGCACVGPVDEAERWPDCWWRAPCVQLMAQKNGSLKALQNSAHFARSLVFLRFFSAFSQLVFCHVFAFSLSFTFFLLWVVGGNAGFFSLFLTHCIVLFIRIWIVWWTRIGICIVIITPNRDILPKDPDSLQELVDY